MIAALRAAGRLPRGEGRRLALAVVLATGAMGASIALLATSGYLISRAAQRPPILALMVAIVAVRVFGIARACLRYGERLSSHDLAFRQLARLRVRFYERLVPLVPGGLRERSSGELLTRFVSDVDTLADLYLRALIPSLLVLGTIAGTSLAAWIVLPAAGLTVLISLLAAALALPWLGFVVARASGAHQAATRARLTSELVETIDGAPELVLAGRAHERIERLSAIDSELARLARRDALASSLATWLGGTLMGAGLLAVAIVAIGAVHAGALSGVLVAALAFLLIAAYEALTPLGTAGRRAHACATAAVRLEEVCAAEPVVVDPPAPRQLSRRCSGAELGSEALCMRDVRLRYGPSERWVLDGATLRIAPGERVALLGDSGAGKTTLAELLVRMRDPDAGEVTLDGIEVRAMAAEELRERVVLCDQSAHLFNTTIRQNLLIARRDAAEREIARVLGAVELNDWVAGLPDGLETIVGEAGELISGGQRRRIALARALLAGARYLILDEPAAHLDAPLAERVTRNALACAEGRGVLLIAHSTAGLRSCERVLRLHAGRISPVWERAQHSPQPGAARALRDARAPMPRSGAPPGARGGTPRRRSP
jgi:ATP-binding cassette, subfamily C, bacterial CydC